MSHLFRYSVKCIDVARTTKKSFVQNDDEHDPHRRQEMKVRFTYEYDEIHVLKKKRGRSSDKIFNNAFLSGIVSYGML